MSLAAKNYAIAKVGPPVAWSAETLRNDPSWMVEISAAQRSELGQALDFFKAWAADARLTPQWLHGNMIPTRANFPLPTLGPVLERAGSILEDAYGLFLLRNLPVDEFAEKDLQLIHAGVAGHIGTVRPQTVFGEMYQSIRDAGQASLIERRGSKHNRALSFHNDPCDVASFLCINPAYRGGQGLFASIAGIHDAMLDTAPEHVETLYGEFPFTYQDYLFVRTGFNDHLMPETTHYAVPIFTSRDGLFAAKYSRFYIDQSQERPECPKLSRAQMAALDAFEACLADERWQVAIDYRPGDLVFSNNFTCFHARTAFEDDPARPDKRRHLNRIWISAHRSRPLSPRFRHYFYRDLEAGAVRGGMPLPTVRYPA